MTFQPLVPLSGIAGLRFVERTQESQQAVFNKSPTIAREITYFKENIFKAATPDDLIGDFILRKVSLGAFGLGDDLDKKYFIKKVLDEGSEDPDAFSNRLVDTRYRKMSEAFGYGNVLGANILQSDFANKIVSSYQTQMFESAVGESDNSIRLALNFKREIVDIANSETALDTAWYQVMGNKPLRTVLETAFGLPPSIGALDIEKQLQMFKEKASKTFGEESLTALKGEENVDRILRDFMVREQLKTGPAASTPGFSALSLLNSGGLGASGTTNLLLSRL